MRQFDYVNYNAPSSFKCIHDVRLVQTLEASVRASARSNHRELVDRLREYCFQIPANRIGYGRFTGYQLKIIQECLTLSVFVVFAYFYLGETIRWNYAISFLCIFLAVLFGFWGTALRQRTASPKSSLFQVQRIIPVPR